MIEIIHPHGGGRSESSEYTIPNLEDLLSTQKAAARGGVLMVDMVDDADDLLALATEILSLIGSDKRRFRS